MHIDDFRAKRRAQTLPGLGITVGEHEDACRGHCFVEHAHDRAELDRKAPRTKRHAFRGWDRHKCSEDGIGAWPEFIGDDENAMRTEVAIGICTRCGATSAAEAATRCSPTQDPSGEWSCPAEEMWEGEDE